MATLKRLPVFLKKPKAPWPVPCEITGEKIVCKLSQEDTLKFDSTNKNNGSKHWLNIQVRTRLNDGTAISQDIKKVDVGRILKDGV